MSSIIYLLATISISIACSEKKGGTTFRGSAIKAADEQLPPEDPASDATTSDDDSENSDEVKMISFEFGGESAKISRQLPADFLFVLDNSSSMNSVYTRVKNAILNIPKERYPKDSEIAVMTGMPSHSADYSVPHPYIARGSEKTSTGANNPNYYFNIALEPGFLDLVSRASILRFKNSFANKPVGNTIEDKYQLAGCDSQWFEPDAKDANGMPCIAGALQNTFFSVECEPNIIAFQQLMEKNVGNRLFRPGAFLHVIFVSDEAHPGCHVTSPEKNADLSAACKSFEQVRGDVLNNTPVAGLKFHGIVPPGSNDLLHGSCGYLNQLIKPSKGISVNAHDASISDYSPMIESVASSGFTKDAVLSLPDSYKSLVRIDIDGIEYLGKYTVSAEKILTIGGLDLANTKKFEVYYLE